MLRHTKKTTHSVSLHLVVVQLSNKSLLLQNSVSQNLPSIIKIKALNAKGPLPVGSLLVSLDVVSMLANIDNNLGITAVRKALDSTCTSSKFPSTDCIAEAVEICLIYGHGT